MQQVSELNSVWQAASRATRLGARLEYLANAQEPQRTALLRGTIALPAQSTQLVVFKGLQTVFG